jgi:16S rRNA (cytidine1402-2'-O)-methyltransferase
MPGTLFVVATPIGNLDDVSFRALRVLGDVGVIAAEDTRRTAKLLGRYDIHTPTTSFHEHNEREKLPALLERLARGEKVALVSDAGTPGVSDPGFRLVRAAIGQGARIEVIPGASAVITALVASGFPTESFTFLGFPPTRGQRRQTWVEQLAREPRTSVFFEAPHRLRATLGCLRPVLGDRQIVIARELTKLHEELIRGTVDEVLTSIPVPRGEVTVVVAPPPDVNSLARGVPADEDIWTEFCRMTERDGVRRRLAIGAIARMHGISSKTVYSAIERAKGQVPSLDRREPFC